MLLWGLFSAQDLTVGACEGSGCSLMAANDQSWTGQASQHLLQRHARTPQSSHLLPAHSLTLSQWQHF